VTGGQFNLGDIVTTTDRFFEELNLRPVINAAGKLTVLGASTISDPVAESMVEAAQRFVDMAELMAVASEIIAEKTGAEAGFITSCAAAGITIATAACLTGGDRSRTEKLPFLVGPPDEIVLQRGHAINFGVPIIQTIALAGASVVEIGTTNRTLPHQLSQAISERTAGVMFVVSHHTHQTGAISLAETVRLAHERDVPVIVDAAAELDLQGYINKGADLVIYSGHKGLNGPTSGIIAGRGDLIDACAQQNSGIGRTMKIGKEGIIGCLAALSQSVHGQKVDGGAQRAKELSTILGGIPGLRTQIVTDATRPTIVRLRLIVDEDRARLNARELVRRLESHIPSIRTRNHGVEQGIVDVDFRTLHPGDEKIIDQAVRYYLTAIGEEQHRQ
jgi:uncharacterized pyridoxal phosphate-dependent enzyme